MMATYMGDPGNIEHAVIASRGELLPKPHDLDLYSIELRIRLVLVLRCIIGWGSLY